MTELDLAPVEAASRLRHLPWLAFLDSSLPGGRMGAYSYVAAEPFLTIRATGSRVEVCDGGKTIALRADPWEIVRQHVQRFRSVARSGLPPFQTGAIGYFAYDLVSAFEESPPWARTRPIAAADLDLPDLALGFYDWVIAHEHATGRTWLVTTDLVSSAADRQQHVLALLRRSPEPDSTGDPPWIIPFLRSNFGRSRYLDAVARAKAYVASGDVYQVNLSHRLDGPFEGDPWALYCRLRQTSPAPYAAYLAFDDATILSASPERFLRLDGSHVETRPIKGTRPRGATPEADRTLADELRTSVKDRAENLMIVDLLRNDLGRVCQTGSVHVPDLFGIEGYASVWQMVSTIAGTLRPDHDAIDLLRACFPGGSVTGCPKQRAMEIIDELEPVRRGIYCGAIGYLSFSGAMDTSIVIRTLVITGGRVYLQVGGAIVADSDPEAEYAETIAKARGGLIASGARLEEW